MLYREIIAVCTEIHTKHINTLCGQKVEFVNVKPGGTYSNNRAVNGQSISFFLHKNESHMCEVVCVAVQVITYTVGGQNVELLNVKPGGAYSDHGALQGLG
jgi:hypothetical protein